MTGGGRLQGRPTQLSDCLVKSTPAQSALGPCGELLAEDFRVVANIDRKAAVEKDRVDKSRHGVAPGDLKQVGADIAVGAGDRIRNST